MLDRRRNHRTKPVSRLILVAFLVFGSIGVLWSVRDQPGSRAHGGTGHRVAVPGRVPVPSGTACWKPAPELAAPVHHTAAARVGAPDRAATGTLADPGRGRWVFVQQDGVGGYVLTQNHRAGPRCNWSSATPASR